MCLANISWNLVKFIKTQFIMQAFFSQTRLFQGHFGHGKRIERFLDHRLYQPNVCVWRIGHPIYTFRFFFLNTPSPTSECHFMYYIRQNNYNKPGYYRFISDYIPHTAKTSDVLPNNNTAVPFWTISKGQQTTTLPSRAFFQKGRNYSW